MQSPPFVMIIFGATGDLARRKLIPALYHLAKVKALPDNYQIIAFTRRDFTDQSYADLVQQDATHHYRHPLDQSTWQNFANHLHYHQSDFRDPSGYHRLAQYLDTLAPTNDMCANRLIYLATPPSEYDAILSNLAAAKLNHGCGEEGQWTRIIIEKPFGRDLATAQELQTKLSRVFQEEQIYRIDHYLGKETVQNILAFRFANGLFEPTWNRDYIDNVQITVAESIGIENRGAYYDQAGALRDVVQNHLLQMLALVAMNEPKSLSAAAIHDAKLQLLSDLAPISDPSHQTAHGQYGSGDIDRLPVPAYRQEPNVGPHSQTATYVALKAEINNNCWRGVPFYLRTGKRLTTRVTEVNIQYKIPASDIFGQAQLKTIPNVLTLRIQPNEGISLQMSVKKPGLTMDLEPVGMEFCYRNKFTDAPDAYERLLLDAITGDQTLFLHDDEVQASWRYVAPILDLEPTIQPELYPAGSWGPTSADQLLAQDGHTWLSHQIVTCAI